MMPLVSIIIPVYNCEIYLQRCLDSIVKQTYENIEILLVNDGSKDNSLAIAKKYLGKDGRIHIFEQENKGVSAARNLALEHLRGEYFCFIDADDYVSNIYIETLVKNLLNSKADISICGYCSSYSSDADFDTKASASWGKYSVEETLIACYQSRKIGVCVWGKLYCTAKVSNVRFDKSLRLGEDQVYFIEALKCVACCVYQDIKLYCYFERPGSAMRAKFDSRFMDSVTVGEFFINASDSFSPQIGGLFAKMEVFSYIPSYVIGAKSRNEESKKIMKILLPKIRQSNTKDVLKYCNRKDAMRYCMIKYFPVLTNVAYRVRAILLDKRICR